MRAEVSKDKTSEKTRPLAKSIIAALSVVLIVFFIILAGIVSYESRINLSKVVGDHIRFILESQSSNISSALWNYDDEVIKTVLQSTVDDDYIKAACIYDMSNNRKKIAAQIGEISPIDSGNTISHPILYTGSDGSEKVIGLFEVTVDYTKMNENIIRITTSIFTASIALLILIIGIVYAIISKFIKPVTLLSESLLNQESSVPQGLYIAKTNIDEIQRLFSALTQMRDRFSSYEKTLVEARDVAEKSSKAKSDFLGNMSHELRTPLNSILGMSGLLVADGKLGEEEREMVETIQEASSTLLAIVNDILDLSKIENNGIVLEKIPFNPSLVTGSVIKTMQTLASKKGLILKSDLNVNAIVLGDPVRINRIITNIISNAIKYTEKGSVETRLSSIKRDPETLIVRWDVVDTGIGIAPDQVDNIFKKFTQADETITRRFGGTGLGLSITKELVEMMSGTITVSSVVGKGSVFAIEIPLTIADSQSTSSVIENSIIDDKNAFESPFEVKPITTAKILAADDNELNQIFIKKILSRLGFAEIDICDNGKQAVSMVEKNDYDIVLMDCHMPEMDGYEATRNIRFMKDTVKSLIPIVALTADAMEGTREKCRAAGMSEYITKPIDRSELERILKKWFSI